MSEKVEKYLWDIKNVIDDIYTFRDEINSISILRNSRLYQFAIERGFEVIGEALRRIRDEDSTIHILHANKIIGLRNIISHEYDRIEVEQLWVFLNRNLPELKVEIENLINKFPPIEP